jgi:hypothetical protein
MFEVLASTELGWSAGLTGVDAVALHDGLVAVATHFPHLHSGGRAHYDGHALRHRVVVYDRATRARRAVFDAIRHPINELAFRGDGDALAIACGSYDGGYAFEGELLVWDLVTNAIRRPLGVNREVVRVRWIDDSRLAVLVRPEHDMDGDDAFSRLYGAELADVDLSSRGRRDPRLSEQPGAPEAFGFAGAAPPDDTAWSIAGGLAPGVRRAAIRDVAYVGGRIAAVDDDCLVCLWDVALRQATRIRGPGSGQQILHVGARVVVAAVERQGSVLYALEGDELRLLRRLDRCYLFSADAHGRLLARDTGRAAPRLDLVLDADGATLHAADLGHFDVFNHSLRLDGGERLYFLRGTPPSQHEHKVLASVDPDGVVQAVMPWDGEGAHRMDPGACLVDDGALVVGYRVHDPRPGKGQRFVARRDRHGATLWQVERPCAPVALAYAPAVGAVLVVSLDGTLAALDARTGAPRGETTLVLDGMLAPPTCIAVDGARATLGTLDGRLVTVSLAY